MTINFKQPRYILPLIILPFLCLFFYVWHSGSAKTKVKSRPEAGIQDNVGEVSADVKKEALSDKLDAYRNTYKEADGYTAVNPIGEEKSSNAEMISQYDSSEKRTLDSIDQQMKRQFNRGSPAGGITKNASYSNIASRHAAGGLSSEDKALTAALAGLAAQRQDRQAGSRPNTSLAPVEKDPMELFKNQMAYVDSMSKSNDPQYQMELQKKTAGARLEELRKKQPLLEVHKAEDQSEDFNTIMPQKSDAFITAIVDENVTGYADSRIRLRLLEDIFAGHSLIKKGTYLYALINGFSGQRVTLSVQSILTGGQILPVKLDVYDQDGIQGLYVPESAFRDFTKDLGGSSMQGVNIQGSSQNGSQFLMSTVDKVFQSTSSAIASAIRKNKAKIKYNSYIYLIDPQAQQNASQKH